MRTIQNLLIAAIIVIGAALQLHAQSTPWVTVYYAGWDKWNAVPVDETQLDYSCGTHWVSFTHAPGAGSFDGSSSGWDATREQAFVSGAHGAGAKAIYGTGGYGADYTGIVSNISASVSFLVSQMNTYGYDGVDIDWEPVASGQASAFRNFLLALRAAKPGILITAACFNYDQVIVDNRDLLDQINLMSYDKSGAWNQVSWHNSAIFRPSATSYGWLGNIEDDANQYISAGVPKEKLGFGIELYAYIWSGVTGPLQTGFGTIQNTIPYWSVMQDFYQKGVPFKWDSDAQAGYFSDFSKFVSMDYETTMVAKAAYCRSKGLGGVIIYEAGVANVPGFSPTEDRMMKQIKHAFLGGPAIPPLPYIPPPPPPEKHSYTVFDDAVDPAWYNTSWGSYTVGAPDPVNASNKTIKFDFAAWTGLRFHHGTSWSDITSVASDTLIFDVYPVTSAFTMTIEIEGNGARQLVASANRWTRIKVACPPAPFSWFHVMNNTSGAYTAYFDNISFAAQNVQNPVSGTFTCTPAALPAGGGTVTLQWTSKNATSASISPAVGSVALNGSVNVSVTATTTYTLTLIGGSGSAAYTAAVVVQPGVPSTPIFVSPLAGAKDQPTAFALRWTQAAGATKYHIQLSIDSLFASTLINDSTLTDTLRQVTGLVEGARYFGRVRAGNSAGWSPYSAAADFTTLTSVPKTPDPPAFVAPASGATVPPDSVMVRWTRVTGAGAYNLQIATDSTFAPAALSDSSLTDTLKVLSGLAPGAHYFSRIRARNAAGWGAFSALERFNVNAQSLAAPVLASPQNGTNQIPLSVSLSWNPSGGATAYDLQIALDAGFGRRVVDTALTATSTTVGPLNRKTWYYWRVRARNAQVTSIFSPVWSFRTVVQAPKPPKNLTIALAAPSSGQSYTLSWTPGEDADQYRSQLSEESAFSTLLVDTASVDSFVTFRQLLPQRTYYARVRSENVAGVSDFSTILQFSTDELGVQMGRGPADFELYQNYPNPFNPSTTIEFDVPVQSEVSIRVYNMLGMEVATLLTGAVPAGRHAVVWNAAGMSSGTYFCRFKAGPYVVVRRLVLMK